jgi:hypothetical protein
MDDADIDPLYGAFGRLVRLHREGPDGRSGVTQEMLGRKVGLSRTSITNIEKGRQHVALHQLFDFAEALGIAPAALLPSRGEGAGASWVAGKLPPGTDKGIKDWAEKVLRK